MSAQADPITFSFLTPTRKRPDLVARLFQSIVETTARLDRLEVILAVDHDDEASLGIEDRRLNVKKVVLTERATMGALNNACYRASSGRYVMLMNDDVILRTRGWDEIVEAVYAGWGDDIGLVHVNDLLFQEKLCTFPLLSRRACEAIGLCPDEYRRYKIDDHIYDTYNLLALIGHRRIAYLPDVIFEHENHEQQHDGSNKHAFAAAANKVYVPKRDIIEQDDRAYLARLDERKESALRLAAVIAEEARRREAARADMAARNRLSAVTRENPYGYRHKSFVAVRGGSGAPKNPRVTVAIVTADLTGAHAQRCIESVKRRTSNYDLVLLDNNRGGDFSHPREMNKVLSIARTDFVVLLDDDVFVEEGWLDGMLACLDEKTAAVTPLHKDAEGRLAYSGMYLAGDGRGTHEHTRDKPSAPRAAQCHCSACLLLDLRKIGALRMDESYRKYFFDLVHSLEVWESGFRAVVAPDAVVTHLGGATTLRGSDHSDYLWAQDRELFIAQWVKTGRLDALSAGIWREDPYTRFLAETPACVLQFAEDIPRLNPTESKKRLAELLLAVREYPLFARLLEIRLAHAALRAARSGDDARFGVCLNGVIIIKKSSGRVKELLDLHAALMNDRLVSYAERVAAAAVMLDPEETVLWKRLGATKFERGDLDAARRAYEQAARIEPKDAHARLNLGKICMQQNAYDDACAHFEEAARLNPEEGEAHVGLAVMAHHLGREDLFRSAVKQARRLSPNHPALRQLAEERAALVAAH